MKRTKTTPSKSQPGKARALDARRLTTIRGGSAISVVAALPPDIQHQHNETLVRW